MACCLRSQHWPCHGTVRKRQAPDHSSTLTYTTRRRPRASHNTCREIGFGGQGGVRHVSARIPSPSASAGLGMLFADFDSIRSFLHGVSIGIVARWTDTHFQMKDAAFDPRRVSGNLVGGKMGGQAVWLQGPRPGPALVRPQGVGSKMNVVQSPWCRQ